MTQPVESGPADVIDFTAMPPAEVAKFLDRVIDEWTVHGGDPVLAQELADMNLEWL